MAQSGDRISCTPGSAMAMWLTEAEEEQPGVPVLPWYPDVLRLPASGWADSLEKPRNSGRQRGCSGVCHSLLGFQDLGHQGCAGGVGKGKAPRLQGLQTEEVCVDSTREELAYYSVSVLTGDSHLVPLPLGLCTAVCSTPMQPPSGLRSPPQRPSLTTLCDHPPLHLLPSHDPSVLMLE